MSSSASAIGNNLEKCFISRSGEVAIIHRTDHKNNTLALARKILKVQARRQWIGW